MNWEFDLLYFLQGLHSPVLDKIMVVITTLGDAGLIWILLAVVLMFTKKYRTCGVTMAVALVMMLVFGNGILKNIFMRERPCWIDESVVLLIKNPHDYSFPSGHTYSSIVAATVLWLANKRAGMAAFVLAVLIAFSRMYLFVHFPTDILTSLFLGVLTAGVAHWLVKRYYAGIAAKLSERKQTNED